MPNLKNIKVRIKSIKSTQKITQAMKLVAASKVRKAQQRVLNSRPFTQKVSNFLLNTASAIEDIDKKDIPLMAQREVKSVGVIIITSDRGLCGSYNTNIIKKALKRVVDLEKSGLTPKLILIGNKANNFFRRAKTETLESFTQMPSVPSVELANLIAQAAEKAYINKTVDQVEIIGTDFISMLRSTVYVKHFLPIKSEPKAETSQHQHSSTSAHPAPEGARLAQSLLERQHTSTILFEPSLESVLESLIPLYLSNVIYHALLEANCSELASRMNAMSNATKNARELIDKLTIIYNKARQAGITQELTEIVGGVEALK